MKKLLFTICLVLLPQFAHADITTGLVHYYPMNQGAGTNVRDQGIGTASDGTIVGTPAPTWTTGKIGPYALNMTGSTGKVDISTSASLFNMGAGAYSVSEWVNYSDISACPSGTDVCGFVSSLGNGGSGNQGDFFFGVQPDGRVAFANFQTSGSGASACRSDLSNPLTINGWHMMTATWDTSTCVLYMDGVVLTQGSINFTGSGDTLGTYIGIMYSGATQYFSKASFDELRIYNRALSQADVTSLYAFTAISGYQLLTHKLGIQGANSCTLPSTTDISGADLIVFTVSSFNGAGALTYTDGGLNNGNAIPLTNVDGFSSTRLRNYYIKAPVTSATWTPLFSATSAFCVVTMSAWSGSDTSSPFDKENGNAANAVTSLQPGPITPSTNGQLIISGFIDAAGTATVNSGFTITDQAAVLGTQAYLVQSSAATINPTWSFSSTNAIAVVSSFKAAATTVSFIPSLIIMARGIFMSNFIFR